MSKIKKVNQRRVSRVRRYWAWMRGHVSKATVRQIHPPEEASAQRVQRDALKPTIAPLSGSKKNYFVEARSWADDLYTSAIRSRNRYQLAFFVAMGLAILLAIAVDGLIPLQHMEPLLVNHYEDGRVSVEPLKQPYAPTRPVEVESEIVRYVINRESYDASSYDTQYSLINLMSSREVAEQYIHAQSIDNQHSPINDLGNHGFRSVHVDNVVFLDAARNNKGKPTAQQTHHNLAQVNFTVTDHFKNSAHETTTALTALVSWGHQGTPRDPNDRWRNWDGFTVTRYTVEQRNV